jgi:hypothetical protein
MVIKKNPQLTGRRAVGIAEQRIAPQFSRLRGGDPLARQRTPHWHETFSLATRKCREKTGG